MMGETPSYNLKSKIFIIYIFSKKRRMKNDICIKHDQYNIINNIGNISNIEQRQRKSKYRNNIIRCCININRFRDCHLT